MEQITSLKSFLGTSETFAGLTFQGLYTMPEDHFYKLYENYLLYKENDLDKYSKLQHLIWDRKKTDLILDEDAYSEYHFLITDFAVNIFFDEHELKDCAEAIKLWHKNFLNVTGYEAKRVKACTYISDPKIRIEVFKIHGNACLCCGSIKRIALDHVVPVSKGGEDRIDNMQPLCTSCNSKKGVKATDYRKVVIK